MPAPEILPTAAAARNPAAAPIRPRILPATCAPRRADVERLDYHVVRAVVRRLRRGNSILRATAADLAGELGRSRETIRLALARLEADGLLRRRANPNPRGGRAASTIEIAPLLLSRDNKRALLQSVNRGSESASFSLPRGRTRAFDPSLILELVTTAAMPEPGTGRGAMSKRTTFIERPLFGELEARTVMRREKPPSALLSAFHAEFCDAYVARFGRRYLPGNYGRTLATYRRFVSLVPDHEIRARIIARYFASDETYVAERGHPLTLMLIESRFRHYHTVATEEVEQRRSRAAALRDVELRERALATPEYQAHNAATSAQIAAWQRRIATARTDTALHVEFANWRRESSAQTEALVRDLIAREGARIH